MNTDPTNVLATEMNGLVDAFFRDTTEDEFAKFLTEIDYTYYKNVTDDVLGQQLGGEKFAWQTVTTCFDFVQGREFRGLVEALEQLPPAVDYQDLSLAA